MDKKAIVLFSIIFLGLFFVLAFKSDSQPSPGTQDKNTASLITAPEQLYDFGTISMANGKVSHVFKINNPTQNEIKIASVTTSCMCTAAYIVKGESKKGPFGMPGMGAVPPADETIKSGESMEVEVVYDPNAHGPAGVGAIDRFVYVTEKNGSALQVEIKAMVTP
ncbi:MAG: DUF1573 domain-containing protein [Candidatus Vogelbacteria bacterium]|nr:DUF1573 domain-containing protein [Candidatus Vogelbacteria bacterium]